MFKIEKKRSFWERLTGSVHLEEIEEKDEKNKKKHIGKNSRNGERGLTEEENDWMKEEEEGQLTVDVYQTPTEVVVQAMVAGVRPDDLQITITRDMVTIRGKREENRTIEEENYFARELYWGTFSRTILLPQEVEPEEAEATERHGFLTIRLPKLDKNKQANVRVKSL
ncbi:hypothetical protein A3I25_01130 [Candidatus Nomurabacteria bacterium RIFCSPLOWO2_02_FULL_42_17]|uniref:Uncharacterized protein n=2 Tax=Candidatus Nomuraibacteriota TaxID=1752729 RepID=A0A1F6WJI0_9BACT|nr:MAG: hypothetical protein A3B93_02380 [Candidatus Nomurabacteria bacterium RIFCSPHIGHO2_02_FULL_42_24]OGI96917.1 MAG: hypothetical protein A3I25_01130 [Candidatus Nomurabacteria bacterium RIFCSPLOWO2_02_FULL_42_17]